MAGRRKKVSEVESERGRGWRERVNGKDGEKRGVNM